MYRRAKTIEDVRNDKHYATCECVDVIGLSRTQFRRLVEKTGVVPVYSEAHGKKPLYKGADVRKLYVYYN